ncbi:MAG: chloride channel protein [Candidatus Altiarchaeales archaeon ex4484_2]|nr:MAG: chloride channel protein [Candidatus Altiarchaeales archaeon ex4484_2]
MQGIPLETRAAVRQIFLAIIVGLLGGAGSILFRETILVSQGFFFGSLLNSISHQYAGLNLSVILIPMIGGLLVGLLSMKVASEVKGHGVPEIMEAVHMHGGWIRKRVAFTKIIASAITVGSGGSAGREGPIAQTGASLGSLIGQIANLHERQRRVLTVSGLAAGIGATFNAPLGAAIFAMEVLFAEFEAVSATSIILASVVGTTFANAVTESLGREYIEIGLMENLALNHPMELSFYLIMGLVLGLLSIVWVRVFYRIEELFDSLNMPMYLKTALGGLLVGSIGVFTLTEMPDGGPLGYGIMGVGYEGVNMALAGSLSLKLLLCLVILKILSTSLTVGSGGSGGVFSSSLYIGAMAGGALGILFNTVAPGIAQVPETYALVGMGALFAGAAHAPLTAIVMIPEMSGDYLLIPAMMMACITSYVVKSLFMKDTIYTLKLRSRGLSIDADHVLSKIRVSDIYTRDVDVVPHDYTVAELTNKMWAEGHIGYPVIDGKGELYGIVTFEDLHDVSKEYKVADICTREVLTVKASDFVDKANNRIFRHDIGRLVVVDEDNPKKIVGIISKTDILRAYQQSLRLKRSWQDD